MSHSITSAGCPVEIRLDTGETVSFTMYPLNDRDIVELDGWVRSEYIKMVRESLKQANIEPGSIEWKQEMSDARAEAFKLGFLTAAGASQMSTVDGLTQLIFQTTRKIDLPREKIRNAMFNPANVRAVNSTLDQLTASLRKQVVSSDNGAKKKPKRKRK